MQPLDIDSFRYEKLYKRFLLYLVVMSACFVYAAVPAYNKSILKFFAGGIMLMSEILLFRLSVLTYKNYKDDVNIALKILIWATILYNLFGMLYGCFWDDNYVAFSYWGNSVYQPSFMLPICLLLGLRCENFFQLFKFVTLYGLFYAITYITTPYPLIYIGLGFVVVFALLSYLPKKWQVAVVAVGGLYLFINYYYGGRAALVRAIAGLLIYLVTKNTFWWSNRIRMIVFSAGVLLPLLMVRAFVNEGFSIFEYAESNKVIMMGGEKEGEMDTRTFLYQEVFDDLTRNKAWLLGKGINGKYFSDYFASKHTDAGESEERIQSEVGFLNILLKGGIAQTVLYLLLLIIAVYNCLFRSDSKFMLIIGLVLLTHFVMLFIEEYIKYDLYNVTMWFFIGMAFSPTCLTRDDEYYEEQINIVFGKK